MRYENWKLLLKGPVDDRNDVMLYTSKTGDSAFVVFTTGDSYFFYEDESDMETCDVIDQMRAVDFIDEEFADTCLSVDGWLIQYEMDNKEYSIAKHLEDMLIELWGKKEYVERVRKLFKDSLRKVLGEAEDELPNE